MLEFIALLQKSVAGISAEKFYSADPLWKWGIVKLIENIGESAYGQNKGIEQHISVARGYGHAQSLNTWL